MGESITAAPVVSVCIANYNGLKFIDACLRSVFEQTSTFPVEVIVHDDASPDGSADYIEQHYPNVTLIKSQTNVGFCIANNRMVAAANGEYVLLLNNDAELYPDAFSTLLAEAHDLGKPAILGLPQYDAETGKLLDRGSLLDPFLNPVPNLDEKRADVGMIMGACLWLPRALWDELGGFPEWFGSIGEDLYLCCKARLTGHAVRVCPRSGFRHWVGKSFGGGKLSTHRRLSTTFKRRALSERNKTFVMFIIYPLPILLPLFPLHLLLLLIEGLFLSALTSKPQYLISVYFPVFSALWLYSCNLATIRSDIQHRDICSLKAFLKSHSPVPYKLQMLIRHGIPDIH